MKEKMIISKGWPYQMIEFVKAEFKTYCNSQVSLEVYTIFNIAKNINRNRY